MFQLLKRDYYLSQAVQGSVSADGKPEEWLNGMAIIAENRIAYEHSLTRKSLQIWGVKV